MCVCVCVCSGSGVERSLQPGVMEGGKFFLAALLRFASHLVKENVTMLQPFSDQVEYMLYAGMPFYSIAYLFCVLCRMSLCYTCAGEQFLGSID